MRWSLRTKILVIFSSLLVSVVFAYLILADRVFREDKELLVFDTNRSNTEQLANEIDAALRHVIDKMEFFVRLLMYKPSSPAMKMFLLEGDLSMLAIRLVEASPEGGHILEEVISSKALEAAHAPSDTKEIRGLFPLRTRDPGDRVVVENRSVGKAAIYYIAVPVTVHFPKGGEKVLQAQALIDGHDILERFQRNQDLSLSFAVTASGEMFAHPRPELVLQRHNASNFELVKIARSQSFPVQQTEFTNEGQRYLGVYRKTARGDLIVLSVTHTDTALAASRLLLEKTIILSSIIITIVLIISLFFANSLSVPLLKLVRATDEIAKGRYDTEITIETHDEIGILSAAFAKMAQEVKFSQALLEEYNRDLEQKVQSRTRELESKNAAIRRQQEVLVRATRLAAVGEIAGQAAHEVLNPLTAMISRIEAVTDRIQKFKGGEASAVTTMKLIIEAWASDLTQGGVAGWMQSMNALSSVQPGKKVAEEDVMNMTLIVKQFDLLATQLSRDLDLLLSEAQRIGRIVDGMRGLSRHSRVRTTIAFATLVSEAVEVSEDLLARHQIRIETVLPRADQGAGPGAGQETGQETGTMITVDTDEMRQVFANLIKNCMDAIEQRRKLETRKGGIEAPGLIRITLLSEPEALKLKIWDNGTGIPLEDRERVFESEFTTKGAEGTGFGLSICRRFVREAGGELRVCDSQPNAFTEFELTLPRATEKVGDDQSRDRLGAPNA